MKSFLHIGNPTCTSRLDRDADQRAPHARDLGKEGRTIID